MGAFQEEVRFAAKPQRAVSLRAVIALYPLFPYPLLHTYTQLRIWHVGGTQ